MNKNMIETLLGAVVLTVAAFFVVFAYNSSGLKTTNGYVLKADFSRVDGVGLGTDVKISGVKVGSITGLNLNPTSYRATLTLAIDNAYKLPSDSQATIASEGLLGGSYVSLVPGADEIMLAEGDTIEFTTPATSLTDLLGKFVFSMGQDNGKASDAQ